MMGVVRDIVLARSVDETAFAIHAFPDKIPFWGIWAVLDGLVKRPLPMLDIPGVQSTWGILVDIVYRGTNPAAGIGGEHYSFVPEHFMCFGYWGVTLLNVFFGWVFGLAFVWVRQFPGNPFLLILGCSLAAAFFGSLVDGRMSVRLGNVAFTSLLPLGVMAAMVARKRDDSTLLLGMTLLSVLFNMLKHLTVSNIFDNLVGICFLAAYSASGRLIQRVTLPQRPPPKGTVPQSLIPSKGQRH